MLSFAPSEFESTMAAVVGQFGREYRRKHGARMPQSHRDAMEAMWWCRTSTLGGHLLTCPGCGKGEGYSYHSCNHRSCPKCGGQQTRRWMESRREELLPVPYFHIVMTVPEETRALIRTHQRKLYPAMLTAASSALLELGKESEGIGGELGVMAILHTWTQTQSYHVHVHCMVPAVAVGPDGKAFRLGGQWLIDKKLVADRFRRNFARLARKAMPGIELPGLIFQKRWVVHIGMGPQGDERLLRYLARYAHRTGMSDHRIVAVTDREVEFRYRDRDRNKSRTMRVSGEEFLRRHLQHVLPKGLHKIRYSGIWAKGAREKLENVRDSLEQELSLGEGEVTQTKVAPKGDGESEQNGKDDWLVCPRCATLRIKVARLMPMPRRQRSLPP